MNQTFSSVLNKPSSEIQPPQAYPTGSYLCLVSGQPTFGKSSQKQTDYTELAYQILQYGEDVNQQQLPPGGLVGKLIRGPSTRFYLTEEAVWRLTEHLEKDLGIDKTGKTVGEMLAEAPGKQVWVHLKHTPSQDGTRMFHEVAHFAKV